MLARRASARHLISLVSGYGLRFRAMACAWSASCPCRSFSVAGQRHRRHVPPSRLICLCRWTVLGLSVPLGMGSWRASLNASYRLLRLGEVLGPFERTGVGVGVL